MYIDIYWHTILQHFANVQNYTPIRCQFISVFYEGKLSLMRLY